MEHKREADIEDYWLIQYQRLLESKPLTLLEKVRVLNSVKSYWNQCVITPTLSSRAKRLPFSPKFHQFLFGGKWQRFLGSRQW